MEINLDHELDRDNIFFYAVLHSTVVATFGVAATIKYFTNELRLGFRSYLCLVMLLIGGPLCQFVIKGPSGLLIFTVGCIIIYTIFPANHLPSEKKHVLITGCDSGFGYELAVKLDSLGMYVYAGCLNAEGDGAKNLRIKASERLKILQLDVTNSKDIEAATNLIKSKVLEEGLWGLVNNAGIWYYAELEVTPEKIVNKIMDVNLFGAMRMTKAVLPLIKKSKGRIVNVASLLGRISMEGNGAYSMSKHALIAYSNTLRLEMKTWEVKVSIVEPTAFYTGGMEDLTMNAKKEEIWESLQECEKKVCGYDRLAAVYTHLAASFQKYPKDLRPCIHCSVSALLSTCPSKRYTCGPGADLFNFYNLLPVRFTDLVSEVLNVVPRHLRLAATSTN